MMRCYACHQPVGAHAHFCSACGAALAFATPATPAQMQQPITVEGAYAPVPLAYAPLAQPPQPAPFARAPFVPAPAFDESYAPPGYATPAVAPPGYAAPAVMPVAMSPGQVSAHAPASPSMVNNVMVTQLTPPTSTAPTVVVDARGGAGTAARAAFFMLSGILLGALWVAAALSRGDAAAWALLFVAAATVAVLLLDIAILNRYPHR